VSTPVRHANIAICGSTFELLATCCASVEILILERNETSGGEDVAAKHRGPRGSAWRMLSLSFGVEIFQLHQTRHESQRSLESRHQSPEGFHPSRQVVGTAPKLCPAFSPKSIVSGILYLESHLISSLKDYCKQRETPENGYLDSSRLV
jgi:hypothetical protein